MLTPTNTPVALQLYSDDAGAVGRFLDDHRIPAEARGRRMRLDRERDVDAEVWLFAADGLAFDLTVLPLDALRQAPLSPVDEKPMRRISATQLRALLAEAEIANYEGGRAREFGVSAGTADNYIRVTVNADGALANQLKTVKVLSIEGKSLQGEV